jgi:hypothetical protein
MSDIPQLLRTSDIRWMGTDVGLYPMISDHAGERLSSLGSEQIPELIAALSREPDFIAAHVILTRITGVEYESMPTWNGLTVELMPDGKVHIDPAQRLLLERRWRHWIGSTPHPLRLPPSK